MNTIIFTIILIIAIALAVLLMNFGDKHNRSGCGVIGFLLVISLSVCLVVHIVALSIVSYEYRFFMAERGAFESTLNEARISGNQYEAAAILKDVAEWNMKLATTQFQNKIFFFDQYIDDRIEDVKPIK